MTEANKRGGLFAAFLLAAVAFAVVVARQTDGDIAVFLGDHVSLMPVTVGVDDKVLQLLMVPLASLTVVFCRLTLGLRMLGPFRPILIAIAIQETGIALGTVFLTLVLAVVVAIRPRLGGGWIPYFGRLSVLLSVVVVVLVAAVLLGANLGYAPLEKLAYFPIIVLALTADGFARALSKEGLPSAAARAAATVLTAVLINLVIGIESVREAMFDHPELVLVEVAAILVVATRLRFGLLERVNPTMRPPADG